MSHYFPLSLGDTTKDDNYSKRLYPKFKKWKRQLINKTNLLRSLDHNNAMKLSDVLSVAYLNLNCHMSKPGSDTMDMKQCLKSICKIIPMEYFGSGKNRKIFLWVVKRILTQTKGECIHLHALKKWYDLDGIPWFSKKGDRSWQLFFANIVVLRTIVKPYIKHCFQVISQLKDRAILFAHRGKNQRFMDKTIAAFMKKGLLVDVNKKYGVHFGCQAERKSVGTLMLIPKKYITEKACRPLVVNTDKRLKYRLSSIKKKLKLLSTSFELNGSRSLYQKWIDFLNKNEGRKIYAMKLDLVDAFGAVDIEQLKSVIESDKSCLTLNEKKFIIDRITNVFVNIRRDKNKLYEWNHGLLQGSNLSPVLCDLYLSYLMHNQIKPFMAESTLFHRTVDDILFITSNKFQIDEFELKFYQIDGVVINENKTKKYVYRGIDDPCFSFCGKVFNMESKETSTAYYFQKGADLRCKFKFWNLQKQFSVQEYEKFFEHCMKFSSVNYYFSKFELNTIGNRSSTVIRNIYDGMCYVAVKFVYLVDSLRYLFSSLTDLTEKLLKGISFILRTHLRPIMSIIKKCQGQYHENFFTFRLLKLISLKAFIAVLHKASYQVYKDVISSLKRMIKLMKFPGLEHHFDLRYVCKLPKNFLNISYHRKMNLNKFN